VLLNSLKAFQEPVESLFHFSKFAREIKCRYESKIFSPLLPFKNCDFHLVCLNIFDSPIFIFYFASQISIFAWFGFKTFAILLGFAPIKSTNTFTSLRNFRNNQTTYNLFNFTKPGTPLTTRVYLAAVFPNLLV